MADEAKEAQKELERLSALKEGYLENHLRWVDKEKVPDWLGIADLIRPIHTNNPKLVSVAKVIQEFENPKLSAKNFENQISAKEWNGHNDGYGLAGWPPSHRGSFCERNLYSSREEGGEVRDYVS